MKKFLSIFLCLIMIIGIVAVDCEVFNDVDDTIVIKSSATTITEYNTGDIIEFGWYPQTDVTSSMASTLNSLAGSTSLWTSYNYYSGTGTRSDGKMTSSDYMRYTDITYNGYKYRGITFDSYRPIYTGETASASNTNQVNNGYLAGCVYWFKYEPIKWRVLDPNMGLVMSEIVLDSQPYDNYVWYGVGSLSTSNDHYGDEAHTYYASNYAKSSIREWLNNDFYNTAFSNIQKSYIQNTTLDNSSVSSSKYDSPSSTDKVFLLSYAAALNSNLGFSSSFYAYDEAREAKGSNYAMAQGLNADDNGNCKWRLRTPYDSSMYICCVNYNGRLDPVYYNDSDVTTTGVRPALKLNLNFDISQFASTNTDTGNHSDAAVDDSDISQTITSTIDGVNNIIAGFDWLGIVKTVMSSFLSIFQAMIPYLKSFIQIIVGSL